MAGLSNTIEVKIELERSRLKALKEFFRSMQKAIEEYEESINAIHIRNAKSNK